MNQSDIVQYEMLVYMVQLVVHFIILIPTVSMHSMGAGETRANGGREGEGEGQLQCSQRFDPVRCRCAAQL